MPIANGLTIDKVEEHVGKDLAEKIEQQEDEIHTYSGLDLKVGGEGMKGFYDKMLPKEIGKYVKKLDKSVKVGTSDLVFPRDADIPTGDEVSDSVIYDEEGNVRDGLKKVSEGQGWTLWVATKYTGSEEYEIEPNWYIYEGENGTIVTDTTPALVGNTKEVWSIPITEKMREKVLEGQTLYQNRENDDPKGAFDIIDDKYVITLFEKADFSTLLHETAHVFWAEIEQFVNNGTASDDLLMDYNKLREWFNLRPGEDITDENREQFARGFEAYLREGRHPVVELETVFERFMKWLMRIYQRATQLNVELTDEVREVFDRMFGVTQELNTAAAELSMEVPSRETMDLMGIPKVEQDYLERAYRQMFASAEKAMVQDRWQSKKDKRKKWAEEAKAKFTDTQAYRSLESLSQGRGLAPGPIEDEFGSGTLDVLKGKRKPSIINDGKDTRIAQGMHPEEAALEMGYDTVQEMMVDLMEAPTIEQIRIRSHNLVKMREMRHDAQFDAKDYLLKTDEYQEILGIKSKWMGRNEGAEVRSRPHIAFRNWAKKKMGDMLMKDATRTDLFMSAMKRYGKSLQSKEKQGDFEGAVREQELHNLNYEFSRESVKIRERVDDLQKRFKRLGEKKQGTWLNDDYREAILHLASTWKFGTPSMVPVSPKEALGKLHNVIQGKVVNLEKSGEFVEEDPFVTDLETLRILSLGERTGPKGQRIPLNSYRDLNVDEFTELEYMVKYLEEKGKPESEWTLLDGSGWKVRDASDFMGWEGHELKKKRLLKDVKALRGLVEKSRKFYATLDSLPFIMQAAGAYQSLGKNKGWSFCEEMVVDRIYDSEATEYKLYQEAMDKFKPIYVQTLKSMLALEKQYGKEMNLGIPLPPELAKKQDGWLPEDLFGLAMNWGNESNKSRIFSGFSRITETEVENLMEYLSTEDMDAIQAIWDMNDAMFDQLSGVFERINKYPLKRIEPAPFEFKGKEYRGGYAPIAYDYKLAQELSMSTRKVTEYEEKDMMQRRESMFQTPVTPNSMTKQRADMTIYPLRLSMGIQFDHIADTIHYISFATTIKDIDRLTRGDLFMESVRDHLGIEVYNQIRPSIQYLARPEKRSVNPEIDRAVRYLKGISTARMLAYNLSVGAKQAFSAPDAIKEMGIKAYTRGLVKAYRNPAAIHERYKEMISKSTAMADRQGNMDRELKDMGRNMSQKQKKLLVKKMLWMKEDAVITWDDVVALGFLPIRGIDAATVLPIWHGAYEQAKHDLKKEGDVHPADMEKQAVRYADRVVRSTQPTAKAVDLPWVLRTGGVTQLLTQFGTYTIGRHQQRIRAHFRALRSKQMDTSEYLEHVMMSMLVPGFGMALWQAVLWGDDFEDEDTYWAVFRGGLSNIIGLNLPYFGTAINPLSEYRWSIAALSSIEELERSVKRVKKDVSNQKWENALADAGYLGIKATAILTKVPMDKVVEKAIRGMDQDEEIIPGVKYVIPRPRNR